MVIPEEQAETRALRWAPRKQLKLCQVQVHGCTKLLSSEVSSVGEGMVGYIYSFYFQIKIPAPGLEFFFFLKG